MICSVPSARIPDSDARLAARVWVAVRGARPPCNANGGDNPFALRIRVSGLAPGVAVKALVDGAKAAMQQGLFDAEMSECARRLATALRSHPQTVASMITEPDAPLGCARRLFTLDGANGVRVTPDDDRCLGAEILAAGASDEARVAVDLISPALRHDHPRSRSEVRVGLSHLG